ncbi:MAG: Hsp20 family protein [Rhodocyclaceae bacterium]|nr:Hsp20 family protein [Rhodocyclaceae bacterium]
MNTLKPFDPVEDLFRGFFVRPVAFGQDDQVTTMRVDVREGAEGYEVHAEMPGIRKEDIHVHVEGPLVSISAERRQDKEEREGDRVIRSERHFGRIARSFQLDADLDAEHTVARFADGVLTLKLPRKEVRPKQSIAIE